MTEAGLNLAAVKSFYDSFASWQDYQRWYENDAVEDMFRHASFEQAHNVFEIGCGTGRNAFDCLQGWCCEVQSIRTVMPKDARYVGCDVSESMVSLTREKVAAFENASVLLAETNRTLLDEPLDAKEAQPQGTPSDSVAVPKGDWSVVKEGSFDRFFATYVFDANTNANIARFLSDGHRILLPGGLLCVVNLTWGRGFFSKGLTSAWMTAYHISPASMGGCRPLDLREHLRSDMWEVQHENYVEAWGLASQVIVAKRI